MALKWEKTLTDELMSELIANPDAFERRLHTDPASFGIDPHRFLQSVIAKQGITLPELIERSGLSKAFVYQIFAGERRPGRDTLIRIALCAELSLDDTQRLLALWERPRLYPRVRRDAALLLCINRGMPLREVSEYLTSVGERPLL